MENLQQLKMERRAEIAFRSLQKPERKYVELALKKLSSVDRATLQKNHNFRKLATSLSDRELFAYRVSPQLSLVVSIADDASIVEDIVNRNSLNRLVKRNQQ